MNLYPSLPYQQYYPPNMPHYFPSQPMQDKANFMARGTQGNYHRNPHESPRLSPGNFMNKYNPIDKMAGKAQSSPQGMAISAVDQGFTNAVGEKTAMNTKRAINGVGAVIDGFSPIPMMIPLIIPKYIIFIIIIILIRSFTSITWTQTILYSWLLQAVAITLISYKGKQYFAKKVFGLKS